MREGQGFDPRNVVSRGNAFLRQQGPKLQHHIRDRIPEIKVVSDWWDRLSPQMKWMYVGMAVLVATSPVSVPLFLDHMQQAGILPQDFHPATAHSPNADHHDPGHTAVQTSHLDITHDVTVVNHVRPAAKTWREPPPPATPNKDINASPISRQTHLPSGEPTAIPAEAHVSPALTIADIAGSSPTAIFLKIDDKGRVTTESTLNHQETITDDTLGIIPLQTQLGGETSLTYAERIQPLVVREFLRNLNLENSEFYAVGQYIFIKNLSDHTVTCYTIRSVGQTVTTTLEFENVLISQIENLQDVFINDTQRNIHLAQRLTDPHLTPSQLHELKQFISGSNLSRTGFFEEALGYTVRLVQREFTAQELTELTKDTYSIDTMTALLAFSNVPGRTHDQIISDYKDILALLQKHPNLNRETGIKFATAILSQSPSVQSVESVIQAVVTIEDEKHYEFFELLRFSSDAIAKKSLTVETLPEFLAKLKTFSGGKIVRGGEGGDYPLYTDIAYQLRPFIKKGINLNELFTKLAETKKAILASHTVSADSPIEQTLVQIVTNQLNFDPDSTSLGEIQPGTLATIVHFGSFGNEIATTANIIGINFKDTQTPEALLSEIVKGYQKHRTDSVFNSDSFSYFLNHIHDWESVTLKSDNYRSFLIEKLHPEEAFHLIIEGAGYYDYSSDSFNRIQYTSTFTAIYQHLSTFPPDQYRALLQSQNSDTIRQYMITLGNYGQLDEEVFQNPDIYYPRIHDVLSSSDLLGLMNTLYDGIQGGLKSAQSDNFQKLIVEKYQTSLQQNNRINAAFFSFIMRSNKSIFDKGYFAQYVQDELPKWPDIETPHLPDLANEKDIHAVFFYKLEDELATEPGGIPKTVQYFPERFGYGPPNKLSDGSWEMTKMINGKTIHVLVSFGRYEHVQVAFKKAGKPIHFMAYLQHSTYFDEFFVQADPKDTQNMVLLAGSCNSAGERLNLIRRGFLNPVVSYEQTGRSAVSAIFAGRFLDALALGKRNWKDIENMEIMRVGNKMTIPTDNNQRILNYALDAASKFRSSNPIKSPTRN